MNKRWMISLASLLAVSALAACSVPKQASLHDESSISTTSSTTTVEAKTGGAKPALEATLKQEGRSATISYQVTNFTIHAEHAGQEPVPGEGHLHLFVDGKEKAELKTEAPVRLENLPAGKHTIKLDLRQNNHTALNVEKVFEIEVK